MWCVLCVLLERCGPCCIKNARVAAFKYQECESENRVLWEGAEILANTSWAFRLCFLYSPDARYCVRYAKVRHLSALIASAMQEPRSSVWLRHGW